MRLVKDRADAKWLPARHRYALFRLLAYVVFRAMGPRPRGGIVLAVDRDQSTFESYTMALWMTLTSSCFAFAILKRVMPGGVALLAAPLAAVAALQAITSVVTIAASLSARREETRPDHSGWISFTTILLVASAALYTAGAGGWPASVAWLFLGTLALNGAAAVVARLLRDRLLQAENEAGAA